MRYGNIALLNNINLDFIGIKLCSLIRTPILWLAFLQIEIMCSEKFSLESNSTPRSLSIFSFDFDIITVIKPKFKTYFLRFNANKLESYHVVAKLALSFNWKVTAAWSAPAW